MKKIVLLLILASAFLGHSQVKIKGVVTYYFNEYQGDKPDLGATVVAVDSTLIKNFDYELWRNFNTAKSYRQMHSNSIKIYKNLEYMYNATLGKKKRLAENEEYKLRMDEAKKSINENLKALEKYNSETDEKFDIIDKKLTSTLFQFNWGESQFIKTTVDAVGNYNINVKPGIYYVYIKSKNRNELTHTDATGVTYIEKVVIKDNDQDVSHNFGL